MWQVLLGSLTGPECRRALDRPGVLVVRFLSTLPAAVIVLSTTWFWWISTQFDAAYSPASSFVGGLLVLSLRPEKSPAPLVVPAKRMA